MRLLVNNNLPCYHCGQKCKDDHFQLKGKSFCSEACKEVFLILEFHDLGDYYVYNEHPGNAASGKFLEENWIIEDFEAEFKDQEFMIIRLSIPGIRNSSCLWLLEHLNRIDTGIVESKADLLKKEVRITIRHRVLSLRKLIKLLCSVNYPPLIAPRTAVREKECHSAAALFKKVSLMFSALWEFQMFN